MKVITSTNLLIRSLLYSLAFSITFYDIGFSLDGIKINIPILLILFLDSILLIRGKFNTKDLLFIAFFLLLCFVSAFFRYPFLYYFPSLAFTICLIFPLGVSWNNINIEKEKLLNYLILGALLSIFFIPIELYFRYMHLFGFKGNELWLNINGHSICYYRASSTMLEPSHYTIVLSFIYIIIDIAREKSYSVKHTLLFKYCFFVALILSVSLSGIVLIGLYFMLKLLNFIIKCYINRLKIIINKRILIKILSGILLLLVFNGLSNNFIGKVGSKVRERVLLTSGVIEKQKSEGSSGVRASFLWVSKIYVTQSPIFNILFGEGFSNYQKWLLDNAKQIGYDSGEAYNLFLVVLLSIGSIGLISFVLMVISISHVNFLVFNEIVFLIILFVSFFTHGYLVMYWVWIPILFFRIIKNNS